MDSIEISEAFSVTAIACTKILEADPAKVNMFGGAVALGHPIGMSGSRMILSTINILKHKGLKYGLSAICNGGGGSTAIILENLQ